jgi:hypothetical protein
MDATKPRAADILLRKYAVDLEGNVNYIEQFLEPGRFLAQRLDFKGFPLDSKVMSVKEIAACRLFSNLREARGAGAVAAKKYALFLANGGRP